MTRPDKPAHIIQRRCIRCDELFDVYTSEKKRVCSKRCSGVKELKTCLHCGQKFKWIPNERFCAKECRLEWIKNNILTTRPKQYTHCSPKRRAMYKKGEYIDRRLVFERDEWTCHICSGKIDPKERLPSLMAASLDHIIPLSKGGTHTWDNVAASHALCNYSKGCELPDLTA
jgi:hypothetical protein